LGEQDICDLFSDQLSDVPDESSDSGDSDSECGSEQKRIVATDYESESSSDESAGGDSVGTATWGKVDKTPTLGQFTGNPGVKQIAELFFGDSFFDMVCQETNRYYFQHRQDYDRNYKVPKCGCHFSRNENFFCNYHSNGAHKEG
jgi:hypothetical protein